MKRKSTRKRIISVILLLSLALSLASCDIIDIIKYGHSYTGGYIEYEVPPDYYKSTYFRWFETFDELLVAIEHLKTAGNEVSVEYIPTYENETVDAKYCIIYRNTANREKSKKGKEWYDLKGWQIIGIDYFGFLDKITIEKLEHSYISQYRYFRVCGTKRKDAVTPNTTFFYNHIITEGSNKCTVLLQPGGHCIATVKYYNMDDHLTKLPQDYITEFPKSFVLLGE